MKRFVVKEWRDPLIAALVVFAIASLLNASAAVVYLLLFAAITIYAVVEIRPPWIMRSLIGRWFGPRR
jgi:hypothetical protein